ncbi:hypothetical protein cypCar_00013052, partial [Cyprinus carpio]
VLTLLINSAYKPSRVLRELQLDQEGRWQGHGETLKAKYKGKSYRATVEIVRTADQVADFCRKTCIKLECCPNLFGPRMVLERCSENCSVLTKTKYSEPLFSSLSISVHIRVVEMNRCIAMRTWTILHR